MTAHKSRKIHLTVLSKPHFITKHIIQYTIRKKILVIKKKKSSNGCTFNSLRYSENHLQDHKNVLTDNESSPTWLLAKAIILGE